MQPPQGALGPFLAAYDRNSAICDIPALLSQFADTFLTAGPDGARALTGPQFASILPRRRDLFTQMGLISSSLDSFEETLLDSRFILARTTWRMRFAPQECDPQDVLLYSTLIVDTGGESPKIVLYLANSDWMAVLRERGIVAA